jgi:CubicO group peptidase (beta-lactamase class C family)
MWFKLSPYASLDLSDGQTTFNLASVTKAFTATAIGLLIDDFAHGRNAAPLPPGLHELTWDTKIQDLLPDEWKLQDAWTSEKASIRDLLSHTSGMPR